MSEYIKREDALKLVKLVVYVDSNEESHGEISYNALEAIPAADVVEVVRCKQCEYYEYDKELSDEAEVEKGLCKHTICDTYPDDYCCYARKRKDGDAHD